MFRLWGVRWAAGIVAALALLAVLRFKPWQRAASAAPVSAANPIALPGSPNRTRQELTVGFLPVT